MPDNKKLATSSRPQCRRDDSEAAKEPKPRYSSLFQQDRAWLPWKVQGRHQGLKGHKVTVYGQVIEVVDKPQPARKKIKGISSRQWDNR